MKKTVLSILLFACLGASVGFCEKPPPLLIAAARCLAVKGFLPPLNTKRLTFGYLLDRKSYQGDEVLYMVNYANPSQSKGLIFAVFLTGQHDHWNFNIQDNASFVLSNSEPDGVSFVSPPLRGDWTQERLTSAIRQIERQPRFAISIEAVSSVSQAGSCESYTDK